MCDSEAKSPPPKRISIKEYAAGALLANAPIWLLSAFLPDRWFEESPIFLALLIYFITMAGGTWAGYLISRKTGQGYLKAGLPTGLFSYSLYALFMTITGVRGGIIEDIPPLIGFVVGGATGSRYWEKQNQQTSTPRKGEQPKKGGNLSHDRMHEE